jgi:hypothetical protein
MYQTTTPQQTTEEKRQITRMHHPNTNASTLLQTPESRAIHHVRSRASAPVSPQFFTPKNVSPRLAQSLEQHRDRMVRNRTKRNAQTGTSREQKQQLLLQKLLSRRESEALSEKVK